MKLVPYHGVLLKEYVGEILKSFDKFQVVPSSMKVFPTNFNGHLSPTVSRPSEGRADRDTVGTGYVTMYYVVATPEPNPALCRWIRSAPRTASIENVGYWFFMWLVSNK